ncbi:MAG: carbon storage regulator [Planctomycetota bacterium]
MLVLTRKQNEKICIGDDVTITVVRTKGKSVRLGIEAPQEMRVLRGEIVFDLGEPEKSPPRERHGVIAVDHVPSEESATALPIEAVRTAPKNLLGSNDWPREVEAEPERRQKTVAWPQDRCQHGPLRAAVQARTINGAQQRADGASPQGTPTAR